MRTFKNYMPSLLTVAISLGSIGSARSGIVEEARLGKNDLFLSGGEVHKRIGRCQASRKGNAFNGKNRAQRHRVSSGMACL